MHESSKVSDKKMRLSCRCEVRLKKLITTSSIRSALALILFSSFVLNAHPAFAQLEIVLYNFCSLEGLCPDGASPVSALTPDGAGDFYGTTLNAGPGPGNVFELVPNGNGSLDEITLHHFTGGADGGRPLGTVILDSAGNLYGTAADGGIGYGVVFEMSRLGSSWNETVLYTFTNGADSGVPWTSLIKDQTGNFYGATVGGTPTGIGGVFKLSPSPSGWTEQIIYSFGPQNPSELPSGLAMDAHGNIFGAVGRNVFELSPNGSGGWTSQVIHTFPADYFSIVGTPAIDQEGRVFGTIQHVSKKNAGPGQVYELSQTNGEWSLQTLASWLNGTGPQSGVVLDGAGNIYGTTTIGGIDGDGTIFELVPKSKRYQRKVLLNFDGSHGKAPVGGLTLGEGGVVYGTTHDGGTQGFGTVFELIP